MIYEEIFRAFRKNKVRYAIVGGIAVNLLGSFRSTADLDILVEMTDTNLSKVVKILTGLGYRVKQPVDPMGIADEKTRKDWIKNKHMTAFNFYKDDEFKEIDIIIDSPVRYEDAKADVRKIAAGDLSLPVVSEKHLIAMKKKAGRPVDRLDIKELQNLQRLRIRPK